MRDIEMHNFVLRKNLRYNIKFKGTHYLKVTKKLI